MNDWQTVQSHFAAANLGLHVCLALSASIILKNINFFDVLIVGSHLITHFKKIVMRSLSISFLERYMYLLDTLSAHLFKVL